MGIGAGLDQLRRNPDLVTSLADGSFENIGNVKSIGDLRNRDVFTLE